jgi:hypothetical protein
MELKPPPDFGLNLLCVLWRTSLTPSFICYRSKTTRSSMAKAHRLLKLLQPCLHLASGSDQRHRPSPQTPLVVLIPVVPSSSFRDHQSIIGARSLAVPRWRPRRNPSPTVSFSLPPPHPFDLDRAAQIKSLKRIDTGESSASNPLLIRRHQFVIQPKWYRRIRTCHMSLSGLIPIQI